MDEEKITIDVPEIPVLLGSPCAVVGHARLINGDFMIIVKGDKLPHFMQGNPIELEGIREIYLGFRYIPTEVQREIINDILSRMTESDADCFAAMPPLKQSDVRQALDEIPPIPDRENIYGEE